MVELLAIIGELAEFRIGNPPEVRNRRWAFGCYHFDVKGPFLVRNNLRPNFCAAVFVCEHKYLGRE